MENSMIVDGIDLAAAGVIKRGTFDERGLPTGWSINAGVMNTDIPVKNDDAVMYIDNTTDNFKVYVRGQFSPTLTEESNKAKKSAS